jgi:hypothetical protein
MKTMLRVFISSVQKGFAAERAELAPGSLIKFIYWSRQRGPPHGPDVAGGGQHLVGAHLCGLDQRCHDLGAFQNIDASGRCIKTLAEFESFEFNSSAVRRTSLPGNLNLARL